MRMEEFEDHKVASPANRSRVQNYNDVGKSFT